MREGDCARGACFRLIGIVAGGKPVEANAAVALAGGGGGLFRRRRVWSFLLLTAWTARPVAVVVVLLVHGPDFLLFRVCAPDVTG